MINYKEVEKQQLEKQKHHLEFNSRKSKKRKRSHTKPQTIDLTTDDNNGVIEPTPEDETLR